MRPRLKAEDSKYDRYWTESIRARVIIWKMGRDSRRLNGQSYPTGDRPSAITGLFLEFDGLWHSNEPRKCHCERNEAISMLQQGGCFAFFDRSQ